MGRPAPPKLEEYPYTWFAIERDSPRNGGGKRAENPSARKKLRARERAEGVRVVCTYEQMILGRLIRGVLLNTGKIRSDLVVEARVQVKGF